MSVRQILSALPIKSISFGLVIVTGFVLPQIILAQSPSPVTDEVQPPTIKIESPTPTETLTPETQPLNLSLTTEPLNLTLSPIFLNLVTDPGVPETTEIMIRNNNSTPEVLEITLGSFEADETGQRPQLLEVDPNEEFLSWLTFSEKSFVVNPGEWKTIQVTFSPPADAALSYYYTLMVSRTEELKVPGETSIVGKPAILVLSTVNSPSARRELTLSSFMARRSWLEFLPQSFQVTIRNTGNVHLNPSGTIFIDGQGQKDLAIIDINPNGSVVIPNSERVFELEWIDGFPRYQRKTLDGVDVKNDKGEQEYELKFDFAQANKLRWGKYTAHLLMVYDNGERDVPIESYVTFWVIPWRFILAVVAVPTIPALLVFIAMRAMMKQRR